MKYVNTTFNLEEHEKIKIASSINRMSIKKFVEKSAIENAKKSINNEKWADN